VNVYYDGNHEHVWPFDEVVFAQQQWQSTTPCYNLPRIGAFTPIVTLVGFQNHLANININLVPTNSKMEQLHLLNKLE